MGTPVTVPMVGKIVSVSVKAGDQVKEDDQVAVLEA
ncbi:MAG: acetyl-CoA carboxylase biotin carboxyl carrier protein subunit, partial [Deltaproteobacteria bacterium]|nr:acetyl-CoA carboxylase biotin carboxyl carrier protein subunit [Deltaproteobacteria bacterium]